MMTKAPLWGSSLLMLGFILALYVLLGLVDVEAQVALCTNGSGITLTCFCPTYKALA